MSGPTVVLFVLWSKTLARAPSLRNLFLCADSLLVLICLSDVPCTRNFLPLCFLPLWPAACDSSIFVAAWSIEQLTCSWFLHSAGRHDLDSRRLVGLLANLCLYFATDTGVFGCVVGASSVEIFGMIHSAYIMVATLSYFLARSLVSVEEWIFCSFTSINL